MTAPAKGELYEPQSFAQWRMLVSPAPLVVWSSAYGKGKTRGICEAADLDARMSEDNMVLVYRKTLASMWDTTIFEMFDKVIDPEHRAWGWKPSAKGGPRLLYGNGSAILFLGADDPDRVKSAVYGCAYGDQAEEIEEEEFEAVDGRLRRMPVWRARHGLSMNPDAKTHWIYRRFRPDRNKVIRAAETLTLPSGKVLPAGRVTAEVIVSRVTDNLHNLPEHYIAALMQKKGVYRRRYWEGKWESFEGSIFAGWDPDVGVIRRPPEWRFGLPPIEAQRVVAIDFGYVDPFVCLWIVKLPADLEVTCIDGVRRMARKGTRIVYRELYTSQTIIPKLMPRLQQLELDEWRMLRGLGHAGLSSREQLRWDDRYPRLPVEARYSDHARQEREIMADMDGGWSTQEAYKDLSPTIQCLVNKLCVDPGELPGILFCEDALVERDEELADKGEPTCTVEEIPLQRWQATADDRAAKEQPVDARNHGCDALRYGVATDEKNGVADVRFL